ncbi:isochorismate synthase [Pseudorhodoferax soli]|uniref:isochorismate synthase n=1 Tax=Pseudorhodoferax soli TaxID=545864 RepID=A0A368Y5G6_9BURK|nr:isochorismate synthase [Pseudorhodoferax soli]RCW75523.1 isochorismate synthase [Pseudorhodoferax soli]
MGMMREDLSRPAEQAADGRARMLLLSHGGGLLSEGVQAQLAVPAAQLGSAVARHFAGAAPHARLVGALPFDRHAPAHLLAPRRVHDADAASAWLHCMAGQAAAPQGWSLQDEPTRAGYAAAVAQAVQRLQAGSGLHKVVLARTLDARSTTPISPWWLARRLAGDPGVLRYVLPLPVEADAAPAWLVGATPELLLSRRGAVIASEPLAGSAARGPDLAASEARAAALRDSAKDLGEHRYVVQAIADLLAPLCRQLRVPATPALHATASMWHLGTRIEGELKDASADGLPLASSAALAALLHPTPAVCGTPRDAAAEAIAALETVPRGFYAGAVGWCDAAGDGAWHVALRCARVQGHTARLFAGAGIVADSSPASEAAETRAKFNAMLHALGIAPALFPHDR